MRWLLMVVWISVIGALGVGVASSLSVDADTLGAGGSVVSSCDRSVDLALVPDADAADAIVAVELDSISRVACWNHRVELVVRGAEGDTLARASGVVSATSIRLDLTDPVDAAAIVGVDVVITER